MLKQLLSVLIFLGFPMVTFADDFVAGKDYVILQEKSQTHHKGVSVTEFFSYGCPWCYRIEPGLEKWVEQQGSKIAYTKIPVVFNKNWEFYAKAYYTAEALGLSSKLSPVLFKAILEEKRPLNTNKAMIDFFTQQGVDTATAKSAFEHSTSIDMKVNEGTQTMARYQINAIPAVVIDNKYKTDLQMAQTEERLFAIMDFLVNRADKGA